MPNGESYFFKKLTNERIIIGEAGKYLTGNVFTSFIKFLKDDWHNYFLTWKGDLGKYGGMIKTWQKTNGIFYIVFTISLLLFILHTWYDEKRKKEYIDLKQQIQKTDNKLYELNVEFNQLIQKRIEIENNIVALHKQYAKDFENEQYKAQLDTFLEKQKNTEVAINKKKEEIITLEHLDQELTTKIKHKIEKVSSSITHKELQKLIGELHSIKKLWQRELTWKEREQLEQEVTGHKRKIPFTLSQSFILFEKEVVYKMAKKCDGFEDGMNLLDMIKLITKEQLINNVIENRFHKIRQARNKWMHDAKLPSEDVIRDLITTLHVYKVEPEV
jgi:cell division protein FtsB